MKKSLSILCLLALSLAFSVSPLDACSCSGDSALQVGELRSSLKSEGRELMRDLKKSDARGKGVIFPREWPTKVYVPRDTKAIDLAEMLKKQEAQKIKAAKYLEKKSSPAAEAVLAQAPIVAEKDGFYIYETHHYRLLSQVKLSDKAAAVVGRLFECSYALSQAVAMALPIARVDAKKSSRNDKLAKSAQIEKLEGRIYKSKAAYCATGVPSSTSGVFQYKALVKDGPLKEEDIVEDAVHIPVESMGITCDGEVDKGFDSHTLVHEITHQLTILNGLPIWANEGMSEYMGYIPYDGDVLDIKVCFANILQHARLCSEYQRLNYPFSLLDYFVMSQADMYRYMEQGVDTYALSAMLIAYFIHLDRKGLPAYQAYLTALLEGKPNKEVVDLLLGSARTQAELQELFIQAWEKQGVTITFAKGASAN